MCLAFAVNTFVRPNYGGPWGVVEQLMWLITTVVMVVGLFLLSKGVDEKNLALGAAAAWGVSALFAVFSLAVERGGSGFGHLFYDANMLVSLVARLLLLSVLVRITQATKAWVMPLLATVALLTVMRIGLSLAMSVLAVDSLRELYMSALFRMGMMGSSLFNSAAIFASAWVAREALRGAPSAAEGHALLVPSAAAPISPAADFVVGGILLLVGIGVTVVSLAAASNGGRYVVATGAIGVGLGRLIRGFIRLSKG
jgi:hypothetical protein